MKSVGTEKGRTVPEVVEVVDETNVVNSAGGLKPGVKTEDSVIVHSSCRAWLAMLLWLA